MKSWKSKKLSPLLLYQFIKSWILCGLSFFDFQLLTQINGWRSQIPTCSNSALWQSQGVSIFFLFDLSTHKSTLASLFEKLHGNIIFVSIISDWHFIWLSPKRQSFGQLTSARIPGILIPECQNKIPLEFHSDKNGPPLYNYKEKTCSFPEWSQTLHCLNGC